ncbi:uncharacterized protein [Chamaea fasciata]|uniref:uncharacterized protein isoform X2 n=1 Tax=Chamaea fasciata TaxID=190680 RepID=UPI00336AAD49
MEPQLKKLPHSFHQSGGPSQRLIYAPHRPPLTRSPKKYLQSFCFLRFFVHEVFMGQKNTAVLESLSLFPYLLFFVVFFFCLLSCLFRCMTCDLQFPQRRTKRGRQKSRGGGIFLALGLPGFQRRVCRQRGCEAVLEADLRKASSPLLMSQEEGAVYYSQTDAGCQMEEREICHVQELLNQPQEDESATGNILRRLPCKWFRSHPVVTLVLIVLVLLVLALAVALAVQSAPQLPVPPATAQCVLGCPSGWVGHNEVCYYLSRDQGTWEQGEERCSELGASLAIVKDEEAMDLLFRLRGNGDYWLGLRRRGQRLQWGDGSNFSSWTSSIGKSKSLWALGNHQELA